MDRDAVRPRRSDHPMSQTLLSELTADLDNLQVLLDEGDGDAAAACLLGHDARLRSYLSLPQEAIDVAALQTLLIRQGDLRQQMIRARDQASAQLRQLNNSRTAATAYQTSRNY